MRIELKCPCGAAIVLEAGTFINGGGAKDSRGREFLVEVRSDEWQERHDACRKAAIGQGEPCKLNVSGTVHHVSRDATLGEIMKGQG